jgi:NAD(P)-dependent dehydrogenase (short-subunit alcohol dehydrogenase family)
MRKALVLAPAPGATIRAIFLAVARRRQTSEPALSKVIVITGAGAGLGRAIGRRFASEGETVILLGRTLSKVEAAAAEIGERAMAVECDVGSPDSVRAAFAKIVARFPKIDVLINNAAVFAPSLVAESSDEHILGTIATNLTGAILCARAAIPLMGPGGYIINVSSESVELPFPHLALYQASKAGLERFSLSLQQELEPQGIRVTIVRAGQMYEEGKATGWDPHAAQAFAKAAMERGLNLMARPISHFTSVTQVFRSLIDLPPDLQADTIQLHARKPD